MMKILMSLVGCMLFLGIVCVAYSQDTPKKEEPGKCGLKGSMACTLLTQIAAEKCNAGSPKCAQLTTLAASACSGSGKGEDAPKK